jgi:chromosome segregation ATPase
VQLKDAEGNVVAARGVLERYDTHLGELERDIARRKECMLRLQEYLALKSELDRKREFFRQWNAKISSLEETRRHAHEDVSEAMMEGDMQEFRRAEQQVRVRAREGLPVAYTRAQYAKVTATLDSLQDNRTKLSSEIERLSEQCTEMLSASGPAVVEGMMTGADCVGAGHIRTANRDDFKEMVIASQVPLQARTPNKFKSIAQSASRAVVCTALH